MIPLSKGDRLYESGCKKRADQTMASTSISNPAAFYSGYAMAQAVKVGSDLKP